MSNNVVEWRFWNPRKIWDSPVSIQVVVSHTWATVHSLSSLVYIPWVKTALERVQKRDPIFREFFDSLFRIQSVSIQSDEPEITLASIMKVTDPETNAEWELDVANFIRFVDIPPHALADEEFTEFISNLMNVADITVGLSVNDNENDEASQNRTRDIKDAPDFLLSKPLLARWDGKQFVDDFELVINTTDVENSLYIHANRFRNPHEIPLWHMALHMALQWLESGISPESNIPVEITHYKDDMTDTVCMKFSELLELIYDALVSQFPLYANFWDRFQVFLKVHKKYIDSMILPLDEIPFDEEE